MTVSLPAIPPHSIACVVQRSKNQKPETKNPETLNTSTDIEYDTFYEWLDDYVDQATDDQLRDLFYNHMECDLYMDPVSYTVEIPPAIIKMAEG